MLVVDMLCVLHGLSGKESGSCDHDSLAASTLVCRAGSGLAARGKDGRRGEDCTNMVVKRSIGDEAS